MLIKYKKIKLYPTEFHVHVFLDVENLEELREVMKKKLPGTDWVSYIKSIGEEVAFVESLELDNGTKTIVMIVRDSNPRTIVHEIVHVLNHLNSYTGIEIGPEAQEWNAYFQDYLYGEISPLLKQ